MTTTQDAGVTVTPATQLPVGTPGRTAPLLFGIFGAIWASRKAKKLGVTDTKRYWIIGAVSTGVSMLLGLLIPVALVLILSASIGSTGTFNNPDTKAPLTGNSAGAPAVAQGGPAQPEATSPGELIRKIEAYRQQAFFTGDVSLLDKYYPNHQGVGWQHDNWVIAERPWLVGNISITIDKLDFDSADSAKIVVDMTTTDRVVENGKTTTSSVDFHNTYEIINGRWYLTESVE